MVVLRLIVAQNCALHTVKIKKYYNSSFKNYRKTRGEAFRLVLKYIFLCERFNYFGRDMQVYLNRSGEQMGPYSVEDVRTYLSAGSVLATDLAWA